MTYWGKLIFNETYIEKQLISGYKNNHSYNNDSLKKRM